MKSTLISTAISNFIQNTFRYVFGKLVAVSFTTESNQPTICVRDFGKGVTNDELNRLSERFYRSEKASDEGSGLGLSIVARIMEVHQGKLKLRNHPEGGLEASLLLPPNNRHS